MSINWVDTPFMTIDSGLNMGWAFAEFGAVQLTGVRRCHRDFATREHKVMWAEGEISLLLREYKPHVVVIESQELWGASADSYASGIRGDLFLLAYMTGAMAGACSSAGVTFRLLAPREWKGQMNKQTVKKRIARALDGEKFPNHAEDAVGMALSLLGKL